MNETTQIVKLAKSDFTTNNLNPNPWGSSEFDRLEVRGLSKYDEYEQYKSLVKTCRFFYKHDPIAATTINKLIDIGITQLTVDQGTLSITEYAAVQSTLKKIQEFLEVIALEYLISGLVIPEISYKEYDRQDLTRYGVKRFSSLILPENLFIRDSSTVKINQSFLSDHPSYFVKIPDNIIGFIQTKGTYPDGTVDKAAYERLATYYPEIISAVNSGKFELKLENKNIIRGKYLSDTPYPIPYLSNALESLKHKRNIRRMDYSIASRVISAIQHVKLGSDDFPVVEGEEEQFNTIRDQMRHRYTSDNSQDVERIFQLFTNHTVSIQWIFPDVNALLDDGKYKEVNQDIIFALGFPRILITGESERTGSSDPQYAMMSPQKTMENIRAKLLNLAIDIIYEVIAKNKFRGLPDAVRFEPINLHDFSNFSSGLAQLYESGNLSRESYAKFFGFVLNDELQKRADEQKKLEELGLQEFGPVPFSPTPNTPGQENNQNTNQENPDNNKKVE